MPKIGDKPTPTTYTPGEAQKILGLTRHRFKQSGVGEFLKYYQTQTRHRQYLREDVHKMEVWLIERQGLIALGNQHKLSPILPPGETMEEKRHRFDAWWEESNNHADCPQCRWIAVQVMGEGPLWCPECGIFD
jgi:hypothetical protein